MALSLVAALLLAAGLQSPSDRSRAEQLARAGQSHEAMELFVRIVEQDPSDIEARLWVARLALRLGRTADAEATFRAVLQDRPGDIDARIGLGMALTRTGEWEEALTILRQVEPEAGDNADLFGALARAYRRAGDDRSALQYFARAKALAPDDPDVIAGFEAVARGYGHAIAFEGFGELATTGANAASGSLALAVRVMPRLHLQASVRLQQRSGSSDTLAGGGAVWRFARAATASVRAVGGSGNASLPTGDFSGEVVHYAGIVEMGAAIRLMSFAGADVAAASSMLSWDPGGRWRLDSRYTYSRSRFDDGRESTGDHSVVARGTWRGWRRVSVNVGSAYGIESFEDLTVDRIGSLGTTTFAAGLRIDARSLTAVAATWEHEWRSNDVAVDRLTVSIVQSFPMIDPIDDIERAVVWLVSASMLMALSMTCAVAVERIAWAFEVARRHRLERRYAPLLRRALEGDQSARHRLATSPMRHRVRIAELLITPLIDDRDPGRIASTRSLAHAMGLIPIADRFLRSRWWWRRAIALRALGLLQDRDHTQVIVAALDDRSADVRAAALDALADLRDPASLPAIIGRMNDASLHIRRRGAAMAPFASQNEPFVLDLAEVDSAHRVNYARVLAVCGTGRSRPALCRWTGDPRPEVCAAAFAALAHVGLDDRAAAVAIDALESGDASVRAMAARALRGWSDAASHLARHLDDTWTVALEAARSLQSTPGAGRVELQAWAARADLAGLLARQMLWEVRAA